MLRSEEEVLPMKIARIAPLYERVPPLLYGGTERIVSYLTEELVRQGHEVTPLATGGYLAFLGRISPEKGPDRAIDIAARLGLPLRIAAKIDKADQSYWDAVIKPLIDKNPAVEFVGEINEASKADFLGNALALLFPIDWPEPFGLVMIEAMACGTPVIAFRRGSVPEIIEDGVSGFVVDDLDSAVQAVAQIETLPRAEVRRCFERRFTAERMAHDYLAIYGSLTKGDMVERDRLQDNQPALLRSAA
jgi:glycosyltransferase involved in cell wall biosynthesis